MMGQVIRSGTGLCDIYLDEDEYIKNLQGDLDDTDNLPDINNQTISQYLEEETHEGDGCDLDEFAFSFE